MSSDEGDHKDFWSRRKAAVRREQEEEQARLEDEKHAGELEALEEKTDAEVLEELGLPDPDTLTKDDDFTRFLAKTVPERLRRRALRRLWVSNPVLACLDGLNDYDEDFTAAADLPGAVKTAYKVGRGFLDSFDVGDETPQASGEDGGPEPNDDGPLEVSTRETLGQQSSPVEDSAALQNTYDENGNTSIALTQSDNSVHSDGSGERDPEDTASIDRGSERPAGRRRLRFDYE